MGVADGELADVRWAADLSRRLRTTAADVASECDVGIEDGHERLEVTVAVAARKASTTRRWLARSVSGSGPDAWTRRRARLACCRASEPDGVGQDHLVVETNSVVGAPDRVG